MTKKQLNQRLVNRIKNTNSVPKLMVILDRIFSHYIRQRDADENGIVTCCTCGKKGHWRTFDCGHFMSRRYMSTRYEERNTGVQCTGCNVFHQGRQYEFAKYLDRRYGGGTADAMLIKSNQENRLGALGFQWLIEEWKQKCVDNGFES